MACISQETIQDSLSRILRYATRKVPYYKIGCLSDSISLKHFPLITKYDIRNNYRSFISDEFENVRDDLTASLEEVRPIGPAIYERIDKNGILIGQTGGSSGVPFRIPKSIDDRMRMGVALWRQRRLIDSSASPNRIYKLVHTGVVAPRYDAWNVDEHNILELYEDINASGGTWLHSYAPMLVRHMKIFEKMRIRPDLKGIKYIECSGYNVEYNVSKKISSFFDANVVDQYGMMETWAIALTCIHGHHHINQENVFLEIINENDQSAAIEEVGRIVVTSLNARLMPIIRYITNDYGKFTKKQCECNLGSITLELSKDRVCELVGGHSKRISGKDLFRRALKKALISTGHDELTYFRVIQTEASHFKVITNNIRCPHTLISLMKDTVAATLEKSISLEHSIVEHSDKSSDERKPWVFRSDI